MLRDTCQKCGEEFTLEMDDTCVYLYEDDAKYHNVVTTCGECGEAVIMFGPEFYAPALHHGYPVAIMAETPWPVRHLWAQALDPDNLPEDPRQNTEDTRTPDEAMDEVVERRFHNWLDHINPGDFA